VQNKYNLLEQSRCCSDRLNGDTKFEYENTHIELHVIIFNTWELLLRYFATMVDSDFFYIDQLTM
jgi:hypothetical protein